MDPEQLIAELEATGDYRVLRRFEPRSSYGAAGGAPLKRGLVVDVETTGLDPLADEIIEFGAVPFRYTAGAAVITAVGAPVAAFEEPRRPIPPLVTQMTGITREMVAGQRIPDAAVEALARDADIVIAHNAGFDRKFLNRRFPVFADKAWGCSQREVPWKLELGGSAALEYLLLAHCGVFFRAHRAAVDCQALVHLLATPLPSGVLPLTLLLESARQSSARIWAVGSPIEYKDRLRARGYRFNNGADGRPKAWWREIPLADTEAEKAWLAENAYGDRPATPEIDKLTARTRYSD